MKLLPILCVLMIAGFGSVGGCFAACLDFALAETGGTASSNNLARAPGSRAFAKDRLENWVPYHLVEKVNDGVYSDASAWVAGAANSFIGVGFSSLRTISAVGYGRDNTGVLKDRFSGTYLIQYATETNLNGMTPDSAWVTLGSVANKTERRQLFCFPAVSAAGVRIKIDGEWHTAAGGGNAIDELEVYGPAIRSNSPPIVTITSPAQGATFFAGAAVKLRAEAVDPDGQISSIKLHDNEQLFSETSETTLELVATNLTVGAHQFYAQAFDESNASGRSETIEITIKTRPNDPPQALILTPTNRSVLSITEPIFVQAEARDDVKIARVEFFIESQNFARTKFATIIQAPYLAAWPTTEPGEYKLSIRAFDEQGLQDEDGPISVMVGEACGGALIVDGAELASQMQGYLYEIGVPSSVLPSAALAESQISRGELLILHLTDKDQITPELVRLLIFAWEQGKALYLIGNAIGARSSALTDADFRRWTSLIHLQPTETRQAGGSTRITDPSHPIMNGAYGVVNDLGLGSEAALRQTSPEDPHEVVLLRDDAFDYMLAYENVSLGGAGRLVSQTFEASVGEISKNQRKIAFQNAVAWLLNCRFCGDVNLVPEGVSNPSNPALGEEIVFSLNVLYKGAQHECPEGVDVVLLCQLSEGLAFESAQVDQGSWNRAEGLVEFRFGKLATSRSARLVARATKMGFATNVVSIRSLNERGGFVLDNELVLVSEIANSRFALDVTVDGSTPVLSFSPSSEFNYWIDYTDDLGSLTWRILPSGPHNQGTYKDSTQFISRFYRLRREPKNLQ